MAKEAPYNGPFDPDRGMFTKKDVPLDRKTLILWRQLAESGKFGRKPEGPPSGEIALALVIQENSPIEQIMDRQVRRTLSGGPQSQYEQQH